MPNMIKSYLVGLGFKVDNHQLSQFNEGLKKAARVAEDAVGGMTKGFLVAGATIGGVLTTIAAGTVGLMAHVAQSDLDMQVFARRMFLSTDAARKMKMATDALGYSVEEIVWGPPELAERYKTLIADQTKMFAALGGTDFEKQMRHLRDIRFEFTRLGLAMQVFSMAFVKDLSKALFGDENALQSKLKHFVDYFEEHMPGIAQDLATKLAPAFHELWRAVQNLGVALKNVDWVTLTNNAIKLTTEMIKFFTFVTAHPWLLKIIGGAVAGGTLGLIGGPVGAGYGALAGGVFGAVAGAPLPKSWENWVNSLGSSKTAGVQQQIIAAAMAAGIDPAAALAIAQQESGFQQFDKSGSAILGKPTKYGRAIGMFQLLPQTAQMEGVDPNSLSGNITGGVNYLSQLYRQYGNWPEAFKHYNGSGAAADAYAAQAMQRYQQFQITINVNSTNATPEEIKKAVKAGVHEASAQQNQRALAQLQGVYA